jgi:hypothetical protein
MGRGISAESRHLIARAYAVLEREHARGVPATRPGMRPGTVKPRSL